ncbi:MAG: HAD family phosphatase [Candidatus Omnitrophota bacterium]|jgi:HAD superfamily hydrolase (TIGR01509 family)|nr:MAG: HAD family phosphatase [Candidatus Omnitrophota bacterium]
MRSNNHDIRAFFFDLDGTLMDTEVLYVEAVRQALADRRCFLSDEEITELVYGISWPDVYAGAIRRFPDVYPSIEAMKAVIYRHFTELRGERDIRLTGSIDLLKSLSREHPTAIVSGSSRRDIEEAVGLMGIAPHIRFFLGAEDYHPGKPHPACYLMAAEKVGQSPAHCLVFEDSSAGVQAAKAAGMICVGLKRNGAPDQDMSIADLVLSDLSDFDVQKL